jgi:hypothetical protein
MLACLLRCSIVVKAVSMESQSIVIGLGNMDFLFMILLGKLLFLSSFLAAFGTESDILKFKLEWE